MGQLAGVLADDNLEAAWKHVSRLSPGAGSDGIHAGTFSATWHDRLQQLRDDVGAGRYRPQPLLRFRVPKPSGGERVLHTAAICDRVLQSAVLNVLEPVLDPLLPDPVHGYRRGRSWRTALQAARKLCEGGLSWACRADIHRFFDSIRHTPLFSTLATLPIEPEPLELLRAWVAGPVIDGECTLQPDCGVPQGLIVAPLLSNLYLLRIDLALSGESVAHIRYGDDLLLLARGQQDAEGLLGRLASLLAELDLSLSPEKTLVAPAAQIRFLGKSVIPPATPHPEPQSQPAAAVSGATRCLYICRPGATLRRQARQLAVFAGEEAVVRVSPRRLRHIVAMGNCHLTLPALHQAAHELVPIYLLSSSGAYWARIEYPGGENLERERRQWAMLGRPEALEAARQAVHVKLANSAELLRQEGVASKNLHRLRGLRFRALRAGNYGELLGIEGAAAAAYFKELSQTLPSEFRFEKRTHHPPADPANSMLSFVYTLLHQNVLTAVRLEGLDPRIGFFHQPRDDFAALASDLMEEFRAPVADRLVVEFCRNSGVRPSDFQPGTGGCWMRPELRRRFLERFESCLWQNVPGASRNWREQIQCQVRFYAEYLLERRKQYTPFRWAVREEAVQEEAVREEKVPPCSLSCVTT